MDLEKGNEALRREGCSRLSHDEKKARSVLGSLIERDGILDFW